MLSAKELMLSKIVGLEKTLESPLDSKEITPVSTKGNQLWIVTERIDAEAEAPILWLPEVKSWLNGKNLKLGNIEVRMRREWQRMRWLDSISDLMDMSLSKPLEIVKDSWAWHVAAHWVAMNWTGLSDWIATTVKEKFSRKKKKKWFWWFSQAELKKVQK